ncbi:MAG: alginate lyase family protein [Chloroflexi bacterium]|nr:alginate lyase family protein [Chloroflexota bacterium]
MKQLVASQAWAREARDRIVQEADNWPSKYLRDFGLTQPNLPPAGGQWSLWYVGPDGLRLRYEPARSPPHFSPTTGQYYSTPPQWPNHPTLYDEVIYASRHDALAQYARFSGLAYALTGERKYADNAAGILRAYALAYPNYALHDKDGKPGKSGGKVHAQTLDESDWLIDIAWAYDLVSDALSPADRTAIASNLLRPAVAVIRNNRAGLSNWQTWHNAAIAIAGFALNDTGLVNDAYNDPGRGFFKQLKDGASADGFWWEGSWGYHFYTLDPMLLLAEMGERAGMNTYAQSNLRAMFTAPLLMAMPDLALPRFNDDTGRVLKHDWFYEAGYNRYRDPGMAFLLARGARPWQALLWGAETLPPAGAAPPPASVLLPKAGYAVLRAGDTRDPGYLAFKFGPHGGWHGHYDKLGYVTFAADHQLALDPGTHSYAADSHEGWDKTTVAHNTIVVDEQDQAEATGNLRFYVGLPAFGLATADAGPAYPNRAALTRTLALTPDYWLDVTRAESLDGRPHRFDWVYHNRGTLATPLALTSYSGLPRAGGYQYLTGTRGAATNDDWKATWNTGSAGQAYGSVWKNRDNAKAIFTVSTGDSGGVAGKLDYDWGPATDAYAFYLTKELRNLPNEAPVRVEARVLGDGSNNRLSLRIIDATGEKFMKNVGAIDWTGWRTVALTVDRTWSNFDGNDNGVMDLPVSQVAFQINRTAGGRQAGNLLVDDIALTFPSAGRLVVEDFEKVLARLDLTVLAARDTTVVTGNGIDQTNQPVPFAMARRQGTETTFAAAFEPYHSSPRIAEFKALSVTPAAGSPVALRVAAPGAFTDTLLLTEGPRGTRAFDAIRTDAVVAYLRQDAANNPQTLVLADATSFSHRETLVFSSATPVTLQLSFTGDALTATVTSTAATQVRVYSPAATGAVVNGRPVPLRRDGDHVLFDLPDQP